MMMTMRTSLMKMLRSVLSLEVLKSERKIDRLISFHPLSNLRPLENNNNHPDTTMTVS